MTNLSKHNRRRKADRRRKKNESSRDSHTVRLTKAAFRIGGDVKIEPCRYRVTIGGEEVGTVSTKTATNLRAFKRGLEMQPVGSGGLHNLDKWHLLDLAGDLGLDKNKCEQMTKAQLVQALQDAGLNL